MASTEASGSPLDGVEVVGAGTTDAGSGALVAASLGDGTARPIVQVGDPVLHHACAPVLAFDDALVSLVADMFASMYAANGVGLAANQIGVSQRVFVYDCPDGDDNRRVGVVVNPVLEPPGPDGRTLEEDLEGCLSVVGEHAQLFRATEAVVHGFGVDGRPVTVEGTGLLARCLQHETDHLDGTLFIDRLSKRARRKVLAAYETNQG